MDADEEGCKKDDHAESWLNASTNNLFKFVESSKLAWEVIGMLHNEGAEIKAKRVWEQKENYTNYLPLFLIHQAPC